MTTQHIKNLIKSFLQFILGYQRYLRVFAWIKVKTLRFDGRERDFFYFLTLLPKEGIVLDVGANLGFLAVYIARRLNRGRVIAFEPMPDNLAVLRFTLARFAIENVDVEPIAVGEEDGQVEMILPIEGGARQQGLAHIRPIEHTDHAAGIPFTVPLRRLDGLGRLERSNGRVVAIKIDVENFEQFVLKGAAAVIARDRPVIYLELWPNQNRRNCFEFARSNGYSIRVHVSGKLADFDVDVHATKTNFFFVP